MERKQTYLVAITILEGRHYIWNNMNSAVMVRVGKQKKSTAVKKDSDCPYYNEYFVFDLETTAEKLLEKNIVLTVIQPRTFCRRRKILGCVKLDIATVVNQKNSQFYHKWAVLASPKVDGATGPTGYLKIDIAVLSRGQTPKLPLHIINDEIEGNLLTPIGFVSERQRAKFQFDVYRCEHLQTKVTQLIDFPTKQSNASGDTAKFSIYVKITFAGFSVATNVKKHSLDPFFNEKLSITDLFPPLCQRIKIEMIQSKNIIATHYINLKHISNDTVEGYLPTFGPTYIYLYAKHPLDNYVGTLLLSMNTELQENPTAASAAQKGNVQHGLAPLDEEKVFTFEETFLFVTILDASSILKKYHDKLISFRLTFGHIMTETNIEGSSVDGLPANVTVGQKPQKSGKNFFFLDFAEEKPCLRIKSKWPDFRKRMYHANMLEKIFKTMKNKLQDIEQMFTKHSRSLSQTIDELLRDAGDFLFSSLTKYVEIIATSYDVDYGTQLDRERKRLSLSLVNSILDKIPVFQTNKSKKCIYRHLEDFQNMIETLIEDAQPCWPDIFLWMISNNKKVACLRVPARKIVYSQIEEEKGEFCGQVRPMLFITEEKNVIICKIDVMMWVGLEKQKDECFKKIPSGFKYEGRLLLAEQKYLFEGRAYIFEGEVEPGFDESGLVDSFIQVAFGKEQKETQVKKHALVPVWNQTLTFYNIYLYGSKEHINQNPPSLLVQMYDEDPMYTEFVGRDLITPNIVFLNNNVVDNKESTSKKTVLKYYNMYNHDEVLGKILAAFEIKEISQAAKAPEDEILPVPSYLKPIVESYKVEILFWGVRQLKKVNMIRINRPRVTFFCGNKSIDSTVIENAKKCSNFTNNVCSIIINMPCQEKYPDAFQFKLFDSRRFGVYVFAGISISDTTPFLFTPMTVDERNNLLNTIQYQSDSFLMNSITSSEIFVDNWDKALIKKDEPLPQESSRTKCWSKFVNIIRKIYSFRKFTRSTKSDYTILSIDDQEEDEADFDWWTKFYASIDEVDSNLKKNQIPPSHRRKLKVFPNELENQAEFEGFSDILTSFEIFKGKRTGDEILDEQLTTAVLKGSVKIYKWPPEDGDENNYVTPNGSLVKNGLFNEAPANTPMQYVLRVYCIRGLNLRPKDLNGKSDAYIQVKLGHRVISDRDNYIPKEVNPIFGRCFEFQASFPEDTFVIIGIYDYDMTSKDDLIGETKIDLENRYFTKHRSRCGIAESYFTSGYCKWRDQKKPTDILKNVCKNWGLKAPEYKDLSVCINSKEFFATDFTPSEDKEFDKEVLALEVLKRWHEMPVVGFKLVPEHVETRSLFAPDKPGIEQGKLQLWIDIFQRLDIPVPEKVDIKPRKPIAYELRVIIWNTEEISLKEDDFYTGEKKSDIYVKGFLDEACNSQYTDVHYRSLTGEGNFNWRFVFKFNYLSSENKLVIKKKESVFSQDESETKLPCVLNLTVWDNDTFSIDDFIGSIALELARMPRGARSANKCNLSIMEPTAKKINLFKIRRTKGWWPFKATHTATGEQVIMGKLEAEFEILTKDEAELNPVGIGRQGPEALPPPNRPDTSFTWFRNPLKSCQFIVCKTWRRYIIGCCCSFLLVCFFALGIYALPSAFINKVLNVL
ncbi:otoferlin isoform X2 [Anthonomus grandis grandis]|uniref:otoferlin isoform X2 n=1 Tax=Anthonomus grandis grandis TaxID=2921223 RepID=UPI002165C8AF|nr:otoferlin isoform X2 [Anthonomus grandis grandis]